MGSEQGKLYQDRLYGTKVLSPLAVEIINSAEFQRLSGLRQLGFTDLVFRGATHSRFEHSVGTYFMCRTMMRRIVQNHDRLGFQHPGQNISELFAYTPDGWLPNETAKEIKAKRIPTSYQARWRGLTEVISAGGLIHDVGHVPFGHTLEDEFTGIYKRHARLAGPRLHEMLFNESSELARVFSNDRERWIPELTNTDLRKLIYLILNWKEKTDPPTSFVELLHKELEDEKKNPDQHKRLEELSNIYKGLHERNMFHPFMSDIVGNTICADLLDYLPRDRMNLGMEFRSHGRLLRYITIRPGTLYHPEEGLRLSILVMRKGHGGQRRDVATTVLDIMRERYQMAERVYYHHKKAAASAMLVKLAEMASMVGQKPRDDAQVYPAPWSKEPPASGVIPHMTHFSDSEFINFLGHAPVAKDHEQLQRRLHQALCYRRNGLYRTLLVIDSDLAHNSAGDIGYFAKRFRDNDGKNRLELEKKLAEAVGAVDGEVLIYCPDPGMQSKEVDARVEIQEGRVLPLRRQREAFAYCGDLDVLVQYYEELWRAYVFVSPEIYQDAAKCRAVVNKICDELNLTKELAYKKVRSHDFPTTLKQASKQAMDCAAKFIRDLPFSDAPSDLIGQLFSEACSDETFLELLTSGARTDQRLLAHFEIITLRRSIKDSNGGMKDRVVEDHWGRLLDDKAPLGLNQCSTFADYEKEVFKRIATEEESVPVATSGVSRIEDWFKSLAPDLDPKTKKQLRASMQQLRDRIEPLQPLHQKYVYGRLREWMLNQSKTVSNLIKKDQILDAVQGLIKEFESDPLWSKMTYGGSIEIDPIEGTSS